MSVLVEFAMFPTDKKGEGAGGASKYVSKVIKVIRDSGVKYVFGSMGTTFETDTLEEANKIIEKSYEALEPFSERVYTCIKMDIRKNVKDRITGKVKSVEDILAKDS